MGVARPVGTCDDVGTTATMWLLLPALPFRDWRGFSFVPVGSWGVTERIAIFVDFQNVHLTGHHCYGGGDELYRCVPNPSKLGDLIAARRKRESEAASIRVYRGRPDPRQHPKPASANDLQAAAWEQDERVTVIRRQLKYRGDEPAQEKGIDVKIAVDMVRSALRREFDALVLFSSDTDLLPALELIDDTHACHVETACWKAAMPLRFTGTMLPYSHWLDRRDWLAVVEDWKGRV